MEQQVCYAPISFLISGRIKLDSKDFDYQVESTHFN